MRIKETGQGKDQGKNQSLGRVSKARSLVRLSELLTMAATEGFLRPHIKSKSSIPYMR